MDNPTLELLQQEEDVEGVLELFKEMDFGVPKQVLRTIHPSAKAVIGRILNNSEIVCIAKDSGKVIGFVSVMLSPLEKSLASLYLCGVKAEFRRKNVGKSLVALALEKCKSIGASKVTCMVPSENTDALIFLIKCGLKPFVYFSDAYSLKQDGILLFKYLRDNGERT